MPAFLGALLLARKVEVPVLVQFLGLYRADDADLIVLSAQLAARVAHWMYM
jgi:hypothetical protein